jgi:hypothetical protein
MRPRGTEGDGVVNVMTFNIQHGIDASGKNNGSTSGSISSS